MPMKMGQSSDDRVPLKGEFEHGLSSTVGCGLAKILLHIRYFLG